MSSDALTLREWMPLDGLNTLGLPSRARYFCTPRHLCDLYDALVEAAHLDLPWRLIGGGSNLVCMPEVHALVIHPQLMGRVVEPLDEHNALVVAAAGEPWHEFVQWALREGWCGLENLSLIPGSVGAAPVQNIGAYGVELADVCAWVEALNTETGKVERIERAACDFGYRDSRFKQNAGRWIILRVAFRLSRQSAPVLSYAPLREAFAGSVPSALEVAERVCALRRERLPDPAVLGNAGSFFKNPVVSAAQAQALRLAYPDIAVYPQPAGEVKLAAAWLIERAGWKGYREDAVGVHDRQALVLVNHGGATARDVLGLAERIVSDVESRFQVSLEREPVVLK